MKDHGSNSVPVEKKLINNTYDLIEKETDITFNDSKCKLKVAQSITFKVEFSALKLAIISMITTRVNRKNGN